MTMAALSRLRSTACIAVPLGAFLLSGCVVSETRYDDLQASYRQSQANNQRLQSENASLKAEATQQQQQNTFTVAADLLFPAAGFDLSASGQAALADIAGKLKILKNSKVVVYGYTDNEKIGASLKKQGVKTNVDLSSKRADAVVNYLVAQGVNPGIVSAKGRGDTHPVADNKTPAGRAQNRRIEIVVEGPGS